MPGDDVTKTFKRCRSAINLNEPTLVKIAQEINLAEMLLLQYLKEVNASLNEVSDSQKASIDQLSQLIIKELEYLRKVKSSEVVHVTGNFATFRSDDGEFLVTVVPEEELQRNFHPFFCFGDIEPRFAKPVQSRHNFAMPCASAESIYYDAINDAVDLSAAEITPHPSTPLGRSICSLLSYIFASTVGKLDNQPDK